MKDGQEAIYWVAGESREALEGSPQIEALRSRQFEVLLATSAVDTWAIEGIGEYRGKKLVSALRADLKLPESADSKREAEQAAKDFAVFLAVTKDTLGDKIREARMSSRLVDSPACLVLAPGALPAHLESLLNRSGKTVLRGQRDLEINPRHPAVKRLGAMAAEDAKNPELRDHLLLLHDQALLAEGAVLDDPSGFAKRLSAVMTKALG
jgi:molecular chaperone HtpG